MKIRLKFEANKLNTKNSFSFNVTPNIWIMHRSTENQKAFALRHNKTSEAKVFYDYTSVFISWLIFSISLTVGKTK
jgi:hypothetical protein